MHQIKQAAKQLPGPGGQLSKQLCHNLGWAHGRLAINSLASASSTSSGSISMPDEKVITL